MRESDDEIECEIPILGKTNLFHGNSSLENSTGRAQRADACSAGQRVLSGPEGTPPGPCPMRGERNEKHARWV